MKKLITFVGATSYEKARYRFNLNGPNEVEMKETKFFAAALIEYLRSKHWKPDEIHVFGTPGSAWLLLW